jgi:heat shock protein HtpX
MPFSFLDIEARKTRRIIFLFLTLLCFYFAGAFLIYSVIRLEFPVEYVHGMPQENLYTLPIMLKIFAAALLVALIHWIYSTINMVSRIISVIGAKPLDLEDRYHFILKNIVDEVSTATGGMHIEPLVIYSGYCNAFALADFKGRTVIGVTEGLLSKMNRRQLEAVIAHEASHLVWGDCLLATISCSVAGVYSGLLKMLTSGWRGGSGSVFRRRGGAVPAMLLLTGLIAFMKFLTLLLNMWISRERELRADATAVRLTRDPLGLAESLYIISGGWRGNQLPAEELAPIFIMTPSSSRLTESQGFLANLFTTHPPTKKRIDILLDMGHADFETLKSGIKEKTRTQDEVLISSSSNSSIWYAQNKEKWLGPFNLIDLSKLDWLTPFTLVTAENNKLAKPAYEYKEINAMLKKGLPFSLAVQTCPACNHELERIYYEGVPIWRCNNCNSKLLKQSHLQRIIIRQEMECSENIKNAVKEIKAAALQTKHKYVKTSPSSFKCPGCGEIMNRTFYMAILPYHLEINICHVCDLIWCDQNELEIIQCIIEEKAGYN